MIHKWEIDEVGIDKVAWSGKMSYFNEENGKLV